MSTMSTWVLMYLSMHKSLDVRLMLVSGLGDVRPPTHPDSVTIIYRPFGLTEIS